ncbi:MAG: VOC family protein [Acidobacteria bacterium]|nr:MAG: VOC family protein [Acidobacteriota bacterium]
MAEDVPRGRFVWYELMTTDPQGAQAFYTQLIGWGTEDFPGEQPYTMWTNDGTPLGGVMELPEEARQQGAPSHWIPYVAVPDVDAAVAQAGGLGAKTYVPPTDIPGAGRFAVLGDPQGAIFAVYRSANEHGGHDDMAEIGEFSWHELATTDHAAAFDFYRQLFGWHETDTMDMGEMGPYLMYGRVPGKPPLGGIFNKPPQMPGPAAWLLYVRVADVDQAVDAVKKLGGQILNGPMEVPGGDRIVQCMDPQGAAFALHSTAAA